MFRFRAFDVDMLHVAQYYKMPIGEIAVTWTEIDGMYNGKGIFTLNDPIGLNGYPISEWVCLSVCTLGMQAAARSTELKGIQSQWGHWLHAHTHTHTHTHT